MTTRDTEPGSSLHVIAVCNRKGGAGKTTAAVNLAAGLADAGQRVLLIDLDTQGHAAVGLGIAPARPGRGVHRLFSTPQTPLSGLTVETAVPNLWLVCADQAFEHGSGLRDEHIIASALQNAALRSAFDVVIIDTPPSLDMLLMNALVAARWVLVPYLPHPLSFEGIRQLMRVLFKVICKHNPDLKVMGFLPMTGHAQIRQHRVTTAQVGQQFGAGRVLPGIRNDIRVAEAFAAGMPVTRYAPSSRGALDFRHLAALVAQLLPLAVMPDK